MRYRVLFALILYWLMLYYFLKISIFKCHLKKKTVKKYNEFFSLLYDESLIAFFERSRAMYGPKWNKKSYLDHDQIVKFKGSYHQISNPGSTSKEQHIFFFLEIFNYCLKFNRSIYILMENTSHRPTTTQLMQLKVTTLHSFENIWSNNYLYRLYYI